MLRPSVKMRFEMDGRLQLLLRLRMGAAHRAPAYARADKGIDEAQLQKIAKTEGELILYRAKLAQRLAAIIFSAAQGSPDLAIPGRLGLATD